MMRLESALHSLAFRLRSGALGRIRLRAGLPAALPPGRDVPFYRHLIERAWPDEDSRATLSACWDVGCRDWSYAAALAEAFPRAALRGVELDPNRRYWNLYRRRDLAEARALELVRLGRNASVHPVDFRAITPGEVPSSEPNAFLFFFPFVSERPCLKWGLPAEHSDFGALLRHARTISGGGSFRVLSAHQGEWEEELAGAAYRKLGVAPKKLMVPAGELRAFGGFPHDVALLWVD